MVMGRCGLPLKPFTQESASTVYAVFFLVRQRLDIIRAPDSDMRNVRAEPTPPVGV